MRNREIIRNNEGAARGENQRTSRNNVAMADRRRRRKLASNDDSEDCSEESDDEQSGLRKSLTVSDVGAMSEIPTLEVCKCREGVRVGLPGHEGGAGLVNIVMGGNNWIANGFTHDFFTERKNRQLLLFLCALL